MALQGSVGEINKLRTFQPQKWKKIKNSQPQTKFTGSYKKKSVSQRSLPKFIDDELADDKYFLTSPRKRSTDKYKTGSKACEGF